MRVAMVSTPFLPVPPPRYGGTELVVWELVEGLVDAGHEVTLFGVGRSRVRAPIRAWREEGVWPPDPYVEQEHAAWVMAELACDARGFDVVHAHSASLLPLARFLDAPVVYTLHHERDDRLVGFYARQRGVSFVAISRRQRELVPELSSASVVLHGLDPTRYPLGRGGRRAVFLGRLAREKGPHLAVEAAGRAGVPIEIAGAAHWKDHEYFAAELAPRLDRAGRAGRAGPPDVRWIGEVGHVEKVALLGSAAAMLAPVCWEEPFGLAYIESMLCGTPVLALGAGSLPELITAGVTGWVCADVDEMAARLGALTDGRQRFDRAACRREAVRRFGRGRMVADYLAVYEGATRALGSTRSDGDSGVVVYGI